MKYLILLLALSACSHEHQLIIEPQYQQYVTTFERDAATVGKSIKVDDLIVETASDLGTTRMGECRRAEDMTPKIVISNRFWGFLNETERQMLFHHELGHCVLNRPHNDNFDSFGEPISLMYMYAFSYEVYLNFKHSYLSELFWGN
jgi:hypothetical protein